MDITKTNKYKKILRREVEQYVLDILTDELMADIEAKRKMATDEETDARRQQLFAEINNSPELISMLKDKAERTYYGLTNKPVKKNERRPITEPDVVEVEPKQGVFSIMRQMALKAGRALIPKQRNDRAKVYADMSGMNM
jgi:hypothetical protein